MNLNKLIKPESPDVDPAHARKVILWGREDLLSRAVRLFLETRMDWMVVRVSNDGNVEDLFHILLRERPDVVILCQDRFDGDAELPLRLINAQLCLKVVTLNLENNLMQVYSKQNVMIQGITDLLSVIEAGIFSDRTLDKEVGTSKQ